MARRKMWWQRVGAAQTGPSFSAVAARFEITEGEVSRLVAMYKLTGNIRDLP